MYAQNSILCQFGNLEICPNFANPYLTQFLSISGGNCINETSRDEHVGEIERYIRTVKERMRAVYNTMPFSKILARLVIEMAKASMFWLNGLPPRDYFGNNLSPRTIVTGQKLDYKRHCRYQFGEYVQTHEQHDNSMDPRMVGALALCPTGNAQGSFYFISLSRGRVLNRLRATPLPMPDEVVDRVHRMARQQKADPGLLFGDRNMNQDDDQSVDSDSSQDDEDFTPYQDDHDEQTESNDDSTKVDHDEEGDIDVAVPEMSNDEETQMSLGDRAPGTVSNRIEDDCHIPAPMMEDDDEHPGTMDREIQGVGDDGDDEQINGERDPHMVVPSSETKADDDYEAVHRVEGSPRYNLRNNQARDYGHAYDPEVYEMGKASPEEARDTVLTTVDEGPEDTPQMSMKKGLQVFGEGGYAAVKQEMQQLHDRKVMQPIRRKDLTPRTETRGAGIFDVPQKEAMWKNQRAWVCRWAEAAHVHHERTIHISDHFDRGCVSHSPG